LRGRAVEPHRRNEAEERQPAERVRKASSAATTALSPRTSARRVRYRRSTHHSAVLLVQQHRKGNEQRQSNRHPCRCGGRYHTGKPDLARPPSKQEKTDPPDHPRQNHSLDPTGAE